MSIVCQSDNLVLKALNPIADIHIVRSMIFLMLVTAAELVLALEVGGEVKGLNGLGLVLRINGGSDLQIDSNGPFSFDLVDGSDYMVTVASQPTNPNETCIVRNGAGTLAGASVTNVFVTCNAMCIPRADGVPGTGLWHQPPNWWDPSADIPPYDVRIDAPGWRGAISNSHPFEGIGVGSGEHVKFRALHKEIDGTEYLYLSWFVKISPNLSSDINQLWVGFSYPDANQARNVAIGVLPKTDQETTAEGGEGVFDLYLKVRNQGSTAWNDYTSEYPGTTLPDWLSDSTRLWVNPTVTGGGTWAVQMRIKLNPVSSPPPSISPYLSDGMPVKPLGDAYQFKMWYEVRQAAPSSITPITPYIWPIGKATLIVSNPGQVVPPPVLEWGNIRLTQGTPESPDTECPSDGISLLVEDVGILVPGSQALGRAVNINGPSTFVARPKNHTGSDVRGITARFRIANWGITTTQASPDLWIDIVDPPEVGLDPTINDGVINNGDKGVIAVEDELTICEKCAYREFYFDESNDPVANDGNDINDDCMVEPTCLATNNTKRSHQCLLVELSGGGGVKLINDSVFRNMDFVNASRFDDEVEINIKNLPAMAGGRDVYLYVEPINMPRLVSSGHEVDIRGLVKGDKDTFIQLKRQQKRSTRVMTAKADQNMSFEELDKVLPSYRIHAYYDSGRKTTINGAEHEILNSMTSFGYYVRHSGPLVGWKHHLEAVDQSLEEITPYFYKIKIPEEGVAKFKTHIEAVERGWATSVTIGANSPRDSFSNLANSGLSLRIGLEYLWSPEISYEAIFGLNRFNSVGPFPDIDVSQFTLNARYYFKPGAVRPFIRGGAGRYKFDPGQSESGFNIGAGFQYDLKPELSLEALFDNHSINSTTPDSAFIGVGIGLRYLF